MTRNAPNRLVVSLICAGSAAFMMFCLASCGANGVTASLDPKAPSEGNFKKAIDEYLATHERDGKACIGFEGLPPFEAYTMTNDPNTQYGQYMRFERAGLLHSSGVGGRKTRFDVTEAGRKVFVPDPDDPIRAQACWANYRVDTVVKWFNHPEDNSMAVNWTYKMTDLVDWAKRPEIASAESDIHVRLDQAGKETRGALLKLSNTGWECTVVTNAF